MLGRESDFLIEVQPSYLLLFVIIVLMKKMSSHVALGMVNQLNIELPITLSFFSGMTQNTAKETTIFVHIWVR